VGGACVCRYVGEKDLAFFKYHAIEGGPCQGASEWQQMMQKDIPGFVRYQSWRRTLPDGKTEYKSVTISPNATAREFSDLYLDDDFRRNWVSNFLGFWFFVGLFKCRHSQQQLPALYCVAGPAPAGSLESVLLFGGRTVTVEPAWCDA
jgi:hypothetical protein